MTIDATTATPRDIYRILSTAIAPRPICFASTVDGDGKVNLSPYSFFNIVSVDPPILGFSPLLRGSDGSSKDTLNNVLAVPEVVINVVEHGIVEQMSLTSVQYPAGVNEFEKAALTQVQSEVVKPPRVGEAAVSFECTVDRVVELGDGPMGGNLILARVQRIHLSDRVLGDDEKIDASLLDLVGRMGGDDYVRARDGRFVVPKPIKTVGIGVDGLPARIRDNQALTGNHLGRLGNLERLPTEAELAETRQDPRVQYALLDGEDGPLELGLAELDEGDAWFALKILLV